MNTFREVIAVILYCIAIVLTIFMFANTFKWTLLAMAILAYLAAYWIWPSKREGQRDDNHWWLDITELLIELPFRIIGWLFKSLKNSDVPDIDL